VKVFVFGAVLLMLFALSACATMRSAKHFELTLLEAESDPAGDCDCADHSNSMDITQVGLWLVDEHSLMFEIVLTDDIPPSYDQNRSYGLLIDTDGNRGTGLDNGDIGSDFSILLYYSSESSLWYCILHDMVNTSRLSIIRSFTIHANAITISLPIAVIGDPNEIRWIAVTQVQPEITFSDIAPDTGHIRTRLPGEEKGKKKWVEPPPPSKGIEV